MENREIVAPDGSQTLITTWLSQELAHYVDSSQHLMAGIC